MGEMIVAVTESVVDAGYGAVALDHDIATQGETFDELRKIVRDAMRCHFGNRPCSIRFRHDLAP